MASTGVPALDRLLGGGYLDRSTILIEGPLSNEKEGLAYEFIRSGLENGDFCLYVTRLSKTDVANDARALGINVDRGTFWMCPEGGDRTYAPEDLASISFGIKGVLKEHEDRKIRVVFDLPSQLLMANSSDSVFRFLGQLLNDLKKYDATLVATVQEDMHPPQVLAGLELLFDGVLGAKRSEHAKTEVRVKKMRGIKPVESPVLATLSAEEKAELASTGPGAKRIAVLPFVNMSPDPSDEYFADGMTEELITSLSGVSDLTVIARTSTMKYKDVSKGASEIAKELSVGTLVEGSIRKAGSRVRITVQLIDAKNEGHLWAQNYDRDLQDIFAIQSDIARQVTEALQVRLVAADKKRFAKSPTSSIEAYTFYLKGRFHSHKVTKDDFKTAMEYYEQAVTIDSKFALAYAEMAIANTLLGFLGLLPSEETGAKAREYAERALRLDDSLAEAHLAMGRILRQYDWNFAGAEAELERALELNPSLAEAHYNIAWLRLLKRRFEEAVVEARRALELDPLFELTFSYAGSVFLASGYYDEAIQQFTKALKTDPDNWYARGNLGLAYVQKGMFDIGIQEMEKVAIITNPPSQSDLAYAYSKAGRLDDLKNLLNKLLENAERNPELAIAVASAFANLGDRDTAFVWLERAYGKRRPYFTAIPYLPTFDCIRQDSRFQALMDRFGFT